LNPRYYTDKKKIIDCLEEAAKRIEEAITILQANGTNTLSQLIISLCNLCQLSIQKNKMDRFAEYFQTIIRLRKTHNLYEDISSPVQSNIIGDAIQKTGNYQEAIRFIIWP